MAKPKPNTEVDEIETESVTVDAPKLVKMTRDGAPPNTADIHPDEVENAKRGGWTVAK